MMRVLALASLFFVSTAHATPAPQLQTVFGDVLDMSSGVLSGISHGIEHVAGDVFSRSKEMVEQWVDNGKEFIKQNGLVYELVTNPSFTDYQLRVASSELCDPSAKQYSGYLDIASGKHLFFWFFESRILPEDAPLTLWLNGGPGCSSSSGLLFELGPCRIADEGKNTTWNEHSWNTHSNMIFLDQPVNVGYSYSDDGSTVDTSPVAAQDVFAFLQLFLQHYPEYSEAPFHLAAESYGGTYAPNIASVIYQHNTKLDAEPVPDMKRINLASLILANGITDPYTQMATVPEYACNGPYAVYDDPEGPECHSLRSKVPICQRLIQSCYTFNSRWTCVPAGAYCYNQLFGPLQKLGVNLYDVRQKCAKEGHLCYEEIDWIETWMNDPHTKAALGVDPELNFTSCNMEVNEAFFNQGDGMHNSAPLLTPLIDNGIRLLVYAGNADIMCNFMGNEAWVTKLKNIFHDEFAQSAPAPWITPGSGRQAGTVRRASGGGSTAGNITFVQVFEAGHMVPYDQPEAALDLFARWISNVPLAQTSPRQ